MSEHESFVDMEKVLNLKKKVRKLIEIAKEEHTKYLNNTYYGGKLHAYEEVLTEIENDLV